MPKPRSLAAAVGSASFGVIHETNQNYVHKKQFPKSEAIIDGPYFPSTYFLILNTRKIIARYHGSYTILPIIVGLS